MPAQRPVFMLPRLHVGLMRRQIQAAEKQCREKPVGNYISHKDSTFMLVLKMDEGGKHGGGRHPATVRLHRLNFTDTLRQTGDNRQGLRADRAGPSASCTGGRV